MEMVTFASIEMPKNFDAKLMMSKPKAENARRHNDIRKTISGNATTMLFVYQIAILQFRGCQTKSSMARQSLTNGE
jgi:hypothetical protein